MVRNTQGLRTHVKGKSLVGFEISKKCPICEAQVLRIEDHYSCIQCNFTYVWNGRVIQHHPIDGPRIPVNPKHDYIVRGADDLRAMYKSYLSGRDIADVSSFVNHGLCFDDGHAGDSPSGTEIAKFLSEYTIFHHSKVIEFGCGRGGNLGYIAGNFRSVQCVGVDLVEDHVVLCGIRYPYGTFIVGDSMQFSVNEYFTHALCVDSLLHYDDPGSFLLRAQSSLMPGGILMIVNVFDASHIRSFDGDLARTGFELVEKVDVTVEVVASMKRKPIFRRKNPFYEARAMIDRLQNGEAQAMFYKCVKVSIATAILASL